MAVRGCALCAGMCVVGQGQCDARVIVVCLRLWNELITPSPCTPIETHTYTRAYNRGAREGRAAYVFWGKVCGGI